MAAGLDIGNVRHLGLIHVDRLLIPVLGKTECGSVFRHQPLRLPFGYLIGHPVGSPQVSSLKFLVRLCSASWIRAGIFMRAGSAESAPAPGAGGSERDAAAGADAGSWKIRAAATRAAYRCGK